MNRANGTDGYEKVVPKYIRATHDIPFEVLHKDFLQFIPEQKSSVLDLGAGFGRDAFELASMGHQVAAVEPLLEFREAGISAYGRDTFEWIADCLPSLKKLNHLNGTVDFVISSGVWHHLDQSAQVEAISRVHKLLKPNGIFAVSLRHGPPGAGKNTFPIHLDELLAFAEQNHFELLLKIEGEPSLMKNKNDVSWSRIVLKKR